MIPTLRAAAVATISLMLLTGLAYPFCVTGLCRILFPRPANGTLVTDATGAVVGSELIGQPFAKPEFFWPRPSAAGNGYDPLASSPSNLGPTSKKLADAFRAEAAKVRAEGFGGPIAADRLSGSGSGLDPDISLDNALSQVGRVAKARGVRDEIVRTSVLEHVSPRTFGLFGEPRVNVLALNLSLLSPRSAQ